ncbi:ubiquitin-activating enzyme E1 3 [Tothia fuscella]|uniref:Ubiquitin-activating enzyme E1-like n=1 Tax=Tothia fuscella TaxID=1048955 RepID=A0A9P4NSX8_9PEZI|nr:ubiquitin-activating enzyme E1 3 [Tothia fuscella]
METKKDVKGRDKFPRMSLGALHGRIKTARVLMVGAGGIGCELLKNIVLTGFGEIHVVDLDTIDLSNLNRQFLFRHEHIKKSKALVAKESAGRFNPNVKIEAHHANIMDPQFNIEWYKGFELVFNALDNVAARRYVNKMCIAADVPLVESGTTGFDGHVQVIKRGVTECYDCTPKEAPRSFPVCTIRSTPSQPIHCIVWGKSYLFTEIFGISEEETPELDFTEDSENAKEIQNLRREAEALKNIRDSMGLSQFPRLIFDKVFKDDIERLLSMEEMWKNRHAPQALDFEQLSKDAESVAKNISHHDQHVWTVAENFAVFVDSLHRLSSRMGELKSNVSNATQENGDTAPAILSFDKDDVDALDFVVASANLRSHIFGIEMRSKFDIKQMAGNIIPAIATTNAIIAGLCVLQAFKVMRGLIDKAPMIFTGGLGRAMTAESRVRPPNPDCTVCGVARAKITIDPSRATLGNLVTEILQGQLGYGEEISVLSDKGVIYDPDLEENLIQKFGDLDVANDSFITIKDEEDGDTPRIDLVFSITEASLPADGKAIQLSETLNIPRKAKAAPTQESEKAVVYSDAPTNGVNGKRKRSATDAGIDEVAPSKKGKAVAKPDADDDVIFLDDPVSGAIVIDD